MTLCTWPWYWHKQNSRPVQIKSRFWYFKVKMKHMTFFSDPGHPLQLTTDLIQKNKFKDASAPNVRLTMKRIWNTLSVYKSIWTFREDLFHLPLTWIRFLVSSNDKCAQQNPLIFIQFHYAPHSYITTHQAFLRLFLPSLPTPTLFQPYSLPSPPDHPSFG